MPDRAGSPTGLGPEAEQSRRQFLQTGLGLAGTALALNVMAAAKPATAAIEAATQFKNRGKRSTTDGQRGARQVTYPASQTEPFHPTRTDVPTAVRMDGTVVQQRPIVPAMADFSSADGLQWLEQHWQEVLEVGIPIGTVATIAKIVHGRVTAAKAMASSFQRALTLLESPDVESHVAAAEELLYLLSDPRSEKYHQRIFATAVDHFRQRNVDNVDRRETLADFKFVPVLVFAASAIRDRLQRKAANVGDAREDYLNASHIHLDGLSLRDADLSHVVLTHATFNGAVLGFANFSHADLTGADLGHTTLNNIDLSHATLIGTRLHGARARDADLRHALLRTTDLGQTDLSYANLEDAELWDDANVTGANIYRATGLSVEMRKKYLELGAIEQN
jgi:uncharacterized protein YjbI with pentapeptide repeats